MPPQPNSKKTPHAELRYSGAYGHSLAGVYPDYEQAAQARREHVERALAEGNKRLAASFEVT